MFCNITILVDFRSILIAVLVKTSCNPLTCLHVRYVPDSNSLHLSFSNMEINMPSAIHKILVSDIVFAETMWTLKGKNYKFTKEQLLTAVDGLFKKPNISFEHGQSVWRA